MPCAPVTPVAGGGGGGGGSAAEVYRGIEVEIEAPGDSWLMHTFLSRQSDAWV